MLPSASSITTTSPAAAAKPARSAAPFPGRRSWTIRTSGRAQRAAKIVSSVDRPSTTRTSSTQRGRRWRTQAMLRSSLSVGMTTLTAGGRRRSRRPIHGLGPTFIGRPPWLYRAGLRDGPLVVLHPHTTPAAAASRRHGRAVSGEDCPRTNRPTTSGQDSQSAFNAPWDGVEDQRSPRRAARTAASVRLLAPSLVMMRDRWFLTVL